MKSIQALRERLNARAKDIRDIVDTHNAAWKPEHQSAYDAGMAEVEDLKAQIKRIEDTNEALAAQAADDQLADAAARRAPKGQGNKARELYAKWLKGGDNAISAAEWAEIRNVTSTTTGNQGGFTVQSDVAAQLIDSLKAFGGMRATSTVITTDQGNPMSFPGSDGTAEVGELIAENTTATDADPVFSTVSLNTFKFSSKVVAVPIELLQDSAIDIEAFVNGRLAQRLGRITNQMFTTGTGSGQPRGIVTGAGAGKTGASGQTTSVIFDDLVDLVHSVDPAYRAAPGVGFMMNDLSLRNVRKLKDSTGRPIFIPGYEGLSGALSDSLLGYSVTVNQDCPVMAANAKSILFGDLRQYYVRDVMQFSLFRFTDSAYTKLGQVGFLAWMRAGGNLLDTAAVHAYANSAS